MALTPEQIAARQAAVSQIPADRQVPAYYEAGGGEQPLIGANTMGNLRNAALLAGAGTVAAGASGVPLPSALRPPAVSAGAAQPAAPAATAAAPTGAAPTAPTAPAAPAATQPTSTAQRAATGLRSAATSSWGAIKNFVDGGLRAGGNVARFAARGSVPFMAATQARGLNEGEDAALAQKWAGVSASTAEALRAANQPEPDQWQANPPLMPADQYNQMFQQARQTAQEDAKSRFLRGDKDTTPVRDFTSDLASVPKELPAGLREGVIYKTKGANGETVYSGRNVKEGADFVGGQGDFIKGRGEVMTIPKEAFAMSSPGSDLRVGEALRAAADRGDFGAIRNFYAQQAQGGELGAGAASGPPPMPDTTGMTRTRAERTMRNWENQVNTYNTRMDRQALREANAARMRFEVEKFNIEQGNKQFENTLKANQEMRAAFGDIKRSLMPQFQTPELKDGKPTGKMLDDEAAFGRFQEQVVAKLGPQAAAQLTAPQWAELAAQYKPSASAVERFSQGQAKIDPSLRQFGAREIELTDVLSPRVGILDWAGSKFRSARNPGSYVLTDPSTGTVAPATAVLGGDGERPFDVRAAQEISPELAAKMGLRKPEQR